MEFIFNPIGSEYLILEVGANSGETGIGLAIGNRNMHVIAFEPVPEMIAAITAKYNEAVERHGPLTNYTLIRAAVSDFNGDAEFNVAGQEDWGCSSLNTFSERLDETWPGRTDFKVTHKIPVKVIRLDTFLQDIPVQLITYMHCDTQGSDIKVLNSMGEYRKCLMRGVIECATSRSVALYKEQHTIEDVVIDFLRWGYEIERIISNDQHLNEVNVNFVNNYARPRATAPAS